MKKKLLLSPLLIIILLVLVGIGVAGAAILVGTTQQGETNTQSVNLQKGLVGWWDFNGNAKDKTLYANDGTVTGATLTTDRKGQTNKAYSFNGTTAQVSAGNPSVLQITGALTISVWVNVTDSASNKTVVGKDASGDRGYSVNVRGSGVYDNKFSFIIGSSATVRTVRYSSSNVSFGSWVHFVGVYSPSANQDVYVNGVLDNGDIDATIPASINNSTQNLLIGNSGWSEYFLGAIDDVRIYNRALSATEVTALYQEYNPGIQISDLQKGLVGWWKMDNNANDSTLYGSNLTNTNSVTFNNDRKSQAFKAGNFVAASSQYLTVADNAALSMGDIDFTITAWVYKDSSPANDMSILGKYNATGNQRAYLLAWSTSADRFRFTVDTDGTGTNATAATANALGAPSNATWYFIVAWHDATANNVNIQVNNGTANSGGHTTGVFDNTAPFRLGEAGNTTPNEFWNGRIDDVRVYKRVLTAAEKTALYQEYNPGIQVSDLQKGLVGQWRLDGNAKDATLYANNGTVTGATLTTDRKGQANKVYNFDGINDWINIPNSSSLENVQEDNYSLSAWFYPDTTPPGIPNGNYAIIQKKGFHIGLVYTGGNKFAMHHYLTGDVSEGATSTNTFSTESWSHVVGVVDRTNGETRIYVNGVLEGTNSWTAGTAAREMGTETWKIGVADTSPTTDFQRWADGKIDDVRIYNRVLSATEVNTLYESY